ncbi:LOW QUALITY PROTEIN: endosialin-like, partial [Chiloscyllium punctatum]
MLLLLVLLLVGPGLAWGTNPGDRSPTVRAVCGPDSCYTAHLERRAFREAWRACRERGGNLASIRRSREARLVEELLEGLPGHLAQGPLKLWLGLQRQPRQCAPHKALRGFTWMTGDQDTSYSNWLQEEVPGSCPASRCVVVSYAADSGHTNHKWLDGSCRLAVDGYLCRFSSPRGMCPGLDGHEPVYSTPFGVTAPALRHVPFGSVATLRCAGGDTQSLLCMAREEAALPGVGRGVGWSREPPFCQEEGAPGWCAGGANGGCQHTCVDEGAFYHCQCRDGYQLGEDGRSCAPLERCPGGLAEDGQCLDVGECRGVGCRGTGVCDDPRGCPCPEGYQLEGGECVDVDECQHRPCAQLCANAEGSYLCYCRVGFTLSEDDGTSCMDVDECQYQGACQQVCINYPGRYQCHCEEGYALEPDGYSCRPLRPHLSPPRRDWGAPTTTTAPWKRRPGTATATRGLHPITPPPPPPRQEGEEPLPRARAPPQVPPQSPTTPRPTRTPHRLPETQGAWLSTPTPDRTPHRPPETQGNGHVLAANPSYPPETQGALVDAPNPTGTLHRPLETEGSRVNKTSLNGTLHRPLETEGSRVNKTSLNGTLHRSLETEGSRVNKTSPNGTLHRSLETEGSRVNKTSLNGTLHRSLETEGSRVNKTSPNG